MCLFEMQALYNHVEVSHETQAHPSGACREHERQCIWIEVGYQKAFLAWLDSQEAEWAARVCALLFPEIFQVLSGSIPD